MEVLTYIALAGLGILIARWILLFAAGTMVPIETTAYAYLAQTLKKRGLSQTIPALCVDECVAQSLSSAKFSVGYSAGREGRIRVEVVNKLEMHADLLDAWVRGGNTFDRYLDSIEGQVFLCDAKAIYERHGIPLAGHSSMALVRELEMQKIAATAMSS